MKNNEHNTPYLQLSQIDKSFGITHALDHVDLDVYEGEVIGLIGPNGAGKSTLMKTLTGVLSADSGEIKIKGKTFDNYSQKESKASGIVCAYQDLSLCTNLKVYENFVILNIDHNLISKKGWRKQYQDEAKRILDFYFPNNNIDVNKPVMNLSLAERQLVEICKALTFENLKVLVLDEPTSALSSDKVAQLHDVIKNLRKRGISIIYISHKLDEINNIANRVALLKNGKNEGYFDPKVTSKDELIHVMGGQVEHTTTLKVDKNNTNINMIEIKNFETSNLHNISMTVNKGEIVGISGLVGSGQTQLLNEIFLASKKGKSKDYIKVNSSISYVSGDREQEGIFPLWDISKNTVISNLNQGKSNFFLNKERVKDLSETWYKKLKFKAEGINSPILSLSGGNQQKALIARGIASGADIIILNDPTAGVDIETKQEIYSLLHEAKRNGKSIILYSTEDSEIEICDRAYIMHEGEITKELIGDEISVSNIVKASFIEVDDNKKLTKVTNKKFKDSRLVIPSIALILMVVTNVILNPNLLSYFGVRTIINSAIPLVFAALGQMFIVVGGDIDMGNGYSIGLVNVLVAVVLTANPLVGIISLILFIVAYMLMGLLIHMRHLPAIVVTLGAQFVWLGIALVISPSAGGSCPEGLYNFFKLKTPIIPMPVLIMIVAAIATWYILFRSKYGMILRGIGNNVKAIERAGWSFVIAKVTNYALAAIMVICSGLSFTVMCLGADPNSSSAFCMQSIAIVILGGCDFAGGFVEPIGVVFGAIAMSLITTLLISLKIDSNFQTAVTGLILIAVLAIKLLRSKKGGQVYA